MGKEKVQIDNSLRFRRQLDIIKADRLLTPIHIIGVGAIGSFTALSIAKMGAQNITVYDDDKVEEHNLPNQFYRPKDIGRHKVDALKDIVMEFTDVEIKTMPKKFDSSKDKLRGIVISGVDSMDTRLELWESIKMNPAIKVYIDGRMGAEVLRMYTINPIDPDDNELYEGNLYPSSEAVPGRCTAKAIMYTVLSVGSLIAGQVKKFCMDEEIEPALTLDMKGVMLYRA